MDGCIRNDRGSVTAEFVITVPAVLAMLALMLGGLQLATHRVVLASAAADIARLEARGDHSLARERRHHLGEVRVQRSMIGGLWCVTITDAPSSGLLSLVSVGGHGCAAVTEGGAKDDREAGGDFSDG